MDVNKNNEEFMILIMNFIHSLVNESSETTTAYSMVSKQRSTLYTTKKIEVFFQYKTQTQQITQLIQTLKSS